VGFINDAVKTVGSVAGSVIGGVTGGIMDASGARDNYQGSTPNINTQDLVGEMKNLSPAQQAYLATLQARSNGQAPSIAQNQLQQTTDQNIQNAASMIGSQTGINTGLKARLIAQNAANMNQQAAGQGAILRAQEQQANTNTLGQYLLNRENILQNANASQNNAINTGSLGAQGISAKAAETNADTAGKMVGGMMQGGGTAIAALAAARGGKVVSKEPVDVRVSPGEIIKVPGKAPVPGDDPRNDIVKAKLPPGSIVVPRTKANNPEKTKEFLGKFTSHQADKKDNDVRSKEFLDAVKSMKEKSKQPSGYAKVLEAHRRMQDALKELKHVS